MGNLEKLGILVIIVLVVTILVLTAWGMRMPVEELEGAGANLSGLDKSGKTDVEPPKPAPAPQPHPIDPWPPAPTPQPSPEPEPEPEPAPTPPAPSVIEHVVKKGETVWGLALQYGGSGSFVAEIQKANRSLDINNVAEGTKLLIPVAAKTSPAPTPAPAPAPAGRTYTVHKGDTLSSIARTHLGAEGRWRELFDKNRGVIGNDPGELRPGMVLVLP